MNFQQVRHPIDYVIQRVRTGRLALPDFQREFVWSPGQVVELLDSISRQWPIGSLLLLSGPQPFAFRAIEGAPATSGTELDLYILDGQQRVTALYHAIANVSKYCYYVDFTELTRGNPDAIKWMARPAFERRYPDLGARARANIALIRDVWDHTAFYTWLNEIRSEQTRDACLHAREDKLTGLQSKAYQIMAIELEKGIELEALARIFETINRTGVALNAFDLLVAKLYPTKFNLRDAWEQAKERHDLLRRFEPSELEILKLVSLLIRQVEGKKHSKGVRQGDLLALESELIVKYWDQSIDLYVSALDACGKFGMTASELVPSWAMVLGVAGCRMHLNEAATERWWKGRLVKQTFAQAANTKIVAEFDSLMKLEASAEDDEEDTELAALLDRPARANGLFTRGLIGLYIAKGAVDAVTGQPLSQCDQIAFRWIDSHGGINKLNSEAAIGRVIALAETSAKKIKRGTDVCSLPHGNQAILSHGLEVGSFARNENMIKAMLAEGGK